MINIIFLDIDGTLIDPMVGSVSAPVKHAIQRLHEKGILPVLVSGRPAFAIAHLANTLSITSYVAYNGGLAIVLGKPIYQHPIEKNLIESLISFSSFRHHPLIFPGHDRYYFPLKVNPFIASVLKKVKWGSIAFDPNYWRNFDIYQIELLAPHSSLSQYKKAFEKQLLFYPWHILANATHVNPYKTSKAIAMKKLLAHLSLDVASSAAIGDGHNDIDMIQTAHIGIAMGNACSELKEAADFVTGDVSEDGVVTALNRLMGLKRL